MYPETILETETAGPLRLEIVHDPEGVAGDPREWTQLGRITIWHESVSIDEAKLGRGYWRVGLEADDLEDEDGNRQAPAEYWAERLGAVVSLPIHVSDYGSSGVLLRTGKPDADLEEWLEADGVIYATEETIEETGAPRDSIADQLAAEINELEHYYAGDVYGFRIRGAAGDVGDSCWGFLEVGGEGDGYGGALEDGRSALETALEELRGKIAEANRIGWRR